jgi:hypothetical protein
MSRCTMMIGTFRSERCPRVTAPGYPVCLRCEHDLECAILLERQRWAEEEIIRCAYALDCRELVPPQWIGGRSRRVIYSAMIAAPGQGWWRELDRWHVDVAVRVLFEEERLTDTDEEAIAELHAVRLERRMRAARAIDIGARRAS